MTSIAIYGYGYVGKAVAQFLGGAHEIRVCDAPLGMDADLYGVNHAIVCVPTPPKADGACDTSIVEAVVRHAANYHKFIMVKSTVPPGTTEHLSAATGQDIVFCPEYVGEGNYPIPHWEGYPHATDMRLHNFHVFGGAQKAVSEWVNIWARAGGPHPMYVRTDSRTAELAKYATNAYLAVKKVFCSELYLAANAMGADYNELRSIWLLDKRIGPSMTSVYPDQLAYGGKCLPKDTRALLRAADDFGYEFSLLAAAIAKNEELK